MPGLFKVTVVMKSDETRSDEDFVAVENRFSACKAFMDRMPRNLSRNHIRFFHVQMKGATGQWMVSPEDIR